MKKSLGTKMKIWAISALTVISGSVFTNCTDEIPVENRFTFTGELIADHLKNNPEYYSSFCVILNKARMNKNASTIFTTLSTYGTFTCFAPTNEAIDEFLKERYNEYIESVEQNKLDSTVKVVNNGVTSLRVEDLTDSMATVIAKNHIIEDVIEFRGRASSQLGKKTMNRRNVEYTLHGGEDCERKNCTLPSGTMTVNVGENDIIIADADIKTENGRVHRINGVLVPSDLTTGQQLSTQSGFTLFTEALDKTGYSDELRKFEIDPEYEEKYANEMSPPFITQNKAVQPYPPTKNYGFTLLVETDELLMNPDNNPFGIEITDIESLEWFAAQWYGTNVDKINKTFDLKGQYKDKNNPLNKFVAYHIIDRKLSYASGQSSGGFIMEKHFQPGNGKTYDDAYFDSEQNLGSDDREGTNVHDRYDYFETAYPYSCLKVTKPMLTGKTTSYKRYGETTTGTLDKEIVLNYTQDITLCKPNMEYHVNVVVEDPMTTTKRRPGLERFNGKASNGNIYTIDKILIYNEEEMKDNILNERMRWDITSLFPELTNNDIRWAPIDNKTMYFIPEGYCERIRYINPTSLLFYLRPAKTYLNSYASYQGDELLATGKYDFEYRIPHVPSGSYEIRIGFSTSNARGMVQFYINGEICGIPLDMRMNDKNKEFMGWKTENETNEEENKENDKAMRNRGFMKAPASIYGQGTINDLEGQPVTVIRNLRFGEAALRRVLGTYDLTNGVEYWIRVKDVTDADGSNNPFEYNQDYLEIVPNTIAKNPDLEDKY